MVVARFRRAMTIRQLLATNLRNLRHAAGMSQEELADRAQVNRNYVGMIERCENAASVDVIGQLADALDVPASDLLKEH
jgi:transcriptional regulator with XRE-family HTH domain